MEFDWQPVSLQWFENHRDVWDGLALAASAPVFQSSDWFAAWCRFLGDGTATLWQARDATRRTVALLPLVQDRWRGLTRWRFAGSGVLCPDHLDLIAEPALRRVLWLSFLASVASREKPDIWVLEGLSEDSTLPPLLAQQHLSCRARTPRICPYLPLAGVIDWPSLELCLTPKLVKELRYVERRLARDLPSVMVHRVNDAADLHTALDSLARMHSQRHGDASPWQESGFRAFHETVAAEALARGRLGLYRLGDETQTLAIAYGFYHDKCYAYYQPAFDPALARYSPGKILISHILRDCLEHGVEEFDLLLGDEPYKFEWTQKVRHEHHLWVAFTWRGRMLLRLLDWRDKRNE